MHGSWSQQALNLAASGPLTDSLISGSSWQPQHVEGLVTDAHSSYQVIMCLHTCSGVRPVTFLTMRGSHTGKSVVAKGPVVLGSVLLV